MQKILAEHRETKVRVIAVWEPILPTDWRAPTSGTLSRLSDARVEQFWDRENLLAKLMLQQAPPSQPKPSCCNRAGILWDLIAVYPPGTVWQDTLPPAVLFDGPVVRASARVNLTNKPF